MYYTLASIFETLVAEFPTALIQLHVPGGCIVRRLNVYLSKYMHMECNLVEDYRQSKIQFWQGSFLIL